MFYISSTTLISVLVLFAFDQPLYNTIQDLSSGLLNINLLTSAILIISTIYMLLIKIGPFRWVDLGASEPQVRIPLAIISFFVMWGAMQVTIVFYLISAGQEIEFADYWLNDGLLFSLGLIIGHLFGNALFEELGFRAFFFPQMDYAFKQLTNQKTALLSALILSQILFALVHLPIRIYNDDSLDVIPFVFLTIYGIGLCFVYIRTRNIFLAITTHALLNFNIPLFDSKGFDYTGSFLLALIAILVFYPRFESKVYTLIKNESYALRDNEEQWENV